MPLKSCLLIAYLNNKIAKFRKNAVKTRLIFLFSRERCEISIGENKKRKKKRERYDENLDAPM